MEGHSFRMGVGAVGWGWGGRGWVEGKDSSSPKASGVPGCHSPEPSGSYHSDLCPLLTLQPLTVNSFLTQMCLLGETAGQPSELIISFFIRIN